MRKIESIREDIDSTDNQIVELLKRRFDLSNQIAEAKKQSGAPVNDPARERDILDRLCAKAGKEYELEVRSIYSAIFSLSKARQRARLNCGNEPPAETGNAPQPPEEAR